MDSSYDTIIKIVIAIIVGIASYYLAVNITNSFHIFIPIPKTGDALNASLKGLANIFLYPLYLFYFIPIISLIFFFLWNVVYYLLLKSPIIKKVEEEEDSKSKPYTIVSVIKNTLIGTISSVLLFVLLVSSILFSMKNSTRLKVQKHYEKSFHTTSYSNDFNDSKIIFYKSEIEKSSKAYMDANDDYALFRAFSEKEIGLKCIKVLLSKHTDNANIYKLSEAFSKNSRNKYAQTKSLIAKYKENDTHFKNREFSYTSGITQSFSRFLDTNMPNSCEEKVSVEKMYRLFLPIYIKKKEMEIDRYKKSITSHNENYIHKKIDNLTSRIEGIRVNEGI